MRGAVRGQAYDLEAGAWYNTTGLGGGGGGVHPPLLVGAAAAAAWLDDAPSYGDEKSCES
jgi:hypothetical protein